VSSLVTFAILTFGCRVNQADSLGIEAALRRGGAQEADPEAADLVVVNTCSVTTAADQSARQAIRRLARTNPRARIVVTGCYATRDPAAVAALPGVVAVVSNEQKEEAWLRAARQDAGSGPCGAPIVPGVAGRTVYTLRVQTGCEEACSYCVIPTTRGPSRSVPVPVVLDQVRRAVGAGYKEIVLTGVHLGAYGRDLSPARSLGDLLRALAEAAGSVRFRLSSIEPMDCSLEIVELVASAGCFAPHFHLPLQHASDTLLRRMRRPYTLEAYHRLVETIRERLPQAAIGADVMVGFPGETEADLAATEQYLRASPLTYVHVFPYADRPGTPASRFADKVPGAVVRARAERVRAVARELAARFRARQVGTVRSALTLEDGTVALTDNYLKVRIAPGLPRNTRVLVRIDRVDPHLEGVVVSTE